MIEVPNGKYYMDKTFKKNLDIGLDSMEDNDDLVIVIDGKERSGKSLLSRQIGKYCADFLGSTFSDKNIFFELNEYVDFSIESPNYTICILDEARNVLNKKAAMSKGNKKFTNYISECAKKRQVHIILLPAYHDLDKYITLWRNKFVIHVHKWYEEDSTKRSGFKLARGKYTLYLNDEYLKKSYFYPYAYPRGWETRGEFKGFEVFSKDELDRYENKKDDNMELKYHTKHEEALLGKREQLNQQRLIKLILHCQNARGITRGEMADSIEMEVGAMNKIILRHTPNA